MDEVVVELTSSFVMADLGIAHEPRAEHAAYIASWLKALKGIRVRSSPPPVRPWPQPTGCTPSSQPGGRRLERPDRGHRRRPLAGGRCRLRRRDERSIAVAEHLISSFAQRGVTDGGRQDPGLCRRATLLLDPVRL